jgi:SAM-dependent methyltransferase
MAQALAADASTIVDVGCGRGALVDRTDDGRALHDLRGPGRRIIGIDIDPVAAENPVIDEFRLIADGRWPLEDSSVDLAICDWVLEHVTDPLRFVAELSRSLRPGGAFLARTVSRRSPVSVAARIVPNHRHSTVVTRLQPRRQSEDVFPTAYGMNDPKTLAALLDDQFDWALSFHPGLEQYALRSPRLARVVAAVEPRLPRRWQHVLFLTARKR